MLDFHTQDIDKLMDAYQHLGGILWNPDCQHVSFIYRRKMYLVRISP